MEVVPHIRQVEAVNGNAYILIRNGLVFIDTGSNIAPKSGLKWEAVLPAGRRLPLRQ
jgi:glyoxylase-like metal-dependent hydrolase (beta-lactamase superfamily II)